MIPAKIRVTTKKGETYIEQADAPAEVPEKPLPFSDYERKFRDCASYAVKPRTAKQIDKIVTLIRQLEQVEDIREIVELLS
jgi:hypothetical protein